MAKFEPESYSRFRILYPKKLFDPLKPYCKGVMRVLDLGAGTGHSSASFSNFYPNTQFTLVEPDPAMLAVAKTRGLDFLTQPEFLEQSAESFQKQQVFEGAIIGSAWHWMKSELVTRNLSHQIRPGGFVFIFEYQFPKAAGEGGLALNEWVRREFNLLWKPEHQKPRGTLAELTQSFRDSSEFSERKRLELEEKVNCDASEFCGLIFSQSRYLDYERRLSVTEQTAERARVFETISKFFSLQTEISLSYSFSGFVFQRRMI